MRREEMLERRRRMILKRRKEELRATIIANIFLWGSILATVFEFIRWVQFGY